MTSSSASPNIADAGSFRAAMGLFGTGVAIAATQIGEEVHAMTANAVSSVSLDPMLVLFCPSKRARLSRYLDAMETFTLSFLRADQRALSSYFAGAWRQPNPPPYNFLPTPFGPRLEGSLAAVGCVKHQIIDAGDHWIVLGRVGALDIGPAPHHPLLFFKGQYCEIDFHGGTAAPNLLAVKDEPASV